MKFIAKNGKVTKEEYEEIKENHSDIIEYAKQYCKDHYTGESTPESIAEVVIYTDEYFRNRYNGYRIISIGTSPSVITEQLAAMGHDVIFLPVSGLSSFVPQVKSSIYSVNVEALEALMQFLESKNINDGKKNIVLDRTASGISLEAITFLSKNILNLKIIIYLSFRLTMKF